MDGVYHNRLTNQVHCNTPKLNAFTNIQEKDKYRWKSRPDFHLFLNRVFVVLFEVEMLYKLMHFMKRLPDIVSPKHSLQFYTSCIFCFH